MDGMAMVTTLKSNAARNTAASITASAYQRRELMGMTCRRAGSVPVGATLLTPGLHLCRCRLPRNSARPSAPDARGLFRPPVSERAAASSLGATGAAACRVACGVQREPSHDDRHDVDLARAGIPALPACPGGVVVPRLERGAAAGADAVRGASVKALHFRAAVATAGVMALLVLHLGAAGAADAVSMTTRALVVSDQARRYLTLAYGSPTEFMGCMIGQVHGPVVFVQRIAPADVDPAHSTRTHVLPRQTCEEAGWTGTVGMIHSHPGGERCFYYFPGTQVASSDAEAFARPPYPVDAIMCGDRIVWIGRDHAQRQVQLGDGAAPATLDHQPGNRVHTGTRAARGE